MSVDRDILIETARDVARGGGGGGARGPPPRGHALPEGEIKFIKDKIKMNVTRAKIADQFRRLGSLGF